MTVEATLLGLLGMALFISALATKWHYKTRMAKSSAKFIFGFGTALYVGIALLTLLFDPQAIYYSGGIWMIALTGFSVEGVKKFVKEQ